MTVTLQKLETRLWDAASVVRGSVEIARQIVEADRMDAEGKLEGNEHPFDPHIGALTQIVGENKPEGLSVLVEEIVTEIDSIVKQVAFSGWCAATNGDRAVKQQLRKTLKKTGLPVAGVLSDRSYEYVKENY